MDVAAFQRDGALKLAGLFDERSLTRLAALPADRPGVRLTGGGLAEAIAPATAAASKLLAAAARPVRAVLFNKTPDTNWLVAWHQDRTIPVKARIDVEGFGPWSRKDGALHVMPPVEVLERMATLRIHIDPVREDTAPLKAALGSHRLGLVAAEAAAAAAEAHVIVECLAAAGDVWAYATPILHASERSRSARSRRVLQVDYAVDELPGGLAWSGVD